MLPLREPFAAPKIALAGAVTRATAVEDEPIQFVHLLRLLLQGVIRASFFGAAAERFYAQLEEGKVSMAFVDTVAATMIITAVAVPLLHNVAPPRFLLLRQLSVLFQSLSLPLLSVAVLAAFVAAIAAAGIFVQGWAREAEE